MPAPSTSPLCLVSPQAVPSQEVQKGLAAGLCSGVSHGSQAPGSPDSNLSWLKAGEVSMSEDIGCADGIQAGMEGGLGGGGLGDTPVPSSMPGSPPQMRRWADTRAWRCLCSALSSKHSTWALPWMKVSGGRAGTGTCLLLAHTPLPVGITPQAPASPMFPGTPLGDPSPGQ